jgi:hypothetical protein
MRTVKGLLHLVPPRTLRISGYDVYAHVVYVVICYMSITCICLCYISVICYMSVICLVLGGVVGLGYILSIVYLCNHMLVQSGGGTWGTVLYTVRGVGSGSRDVDAWRTNGSVRRVSGAPSTDDPGAWTRHLQWQIRARV